MSRKDTIIIALLVNAGLLALLFMLAVNTDDGTINSTPEINKTLTEAQQPKAPAPSIQIAAAPVPVDIDSFLKDMPTDDHSSQVIMDEEGYVDPIPATPVIVKPSQPAEAPASKEIQYVEVTVKRGDALEKIARSNGTTVEAIKKVNNLSSTKLSIGQVLKVPVSSKIAFAEVQESAPAPKPTPKPAPTPAPSTPKPTPPVQAPVAQSTPASSTQPQYYTVKPGDSPWKIAKQFNVEVDELLRLNNLDEGKAKNLKVGEKIRVR